MGKHPVVSPGRHAIKYSAGEPLTSSHNDGFVMRLCVVVRMRSQYMGANALKPVLERPPA